MATRRVLTDLPNHPLPYTGQGYESRDLLVAAYTILSNGLAASGAKRLTIGRFSVLAGGIGVGRFNSWTHTFNGGGVEAHRFWARHGLGDGSDAGATIDALERLGQGVEAMPTLQDYVASPLYGQLFWIRPSVAIAGRSRGTKRKRIADATEDGADRA